MKKYIKPTTDIVVIRLDNSVLDDPGMGDWSNGAGELGGKQNDFDWDDDDKGFVPDLWADDEDEEY